MRYSSIIGRSEMPFQIFIGGRGIGKTYSAIADIAENASSEHPYIYLRRTEEEVSKLSGELGNPFKSYNTNNGTYITIEASKRVGFIYDDTDMEKGRVFKGYAMPLSTFSKMRGVDFTDVSVTVFDEFIPEKHVHKISAEGEAFLHFYETVNRNREFNGQPPMRVYMLANSISLNNDILITLGVVSKIAEMKVKGQKKYTDKKRGIYIELMENAEFTNAKKETALYKLTGGTSFSEQALNNSFTGDDMSMVTKDINLNEYKPVIGFDIYTVYQHKSSGDIYIAKKKSDGIKCLQATDKDVLYWRFAPQYRLATLQRSIKYDDYATKLVFDALTSR